MGGELFVISDRVTLDLKLSDEDFHEDFEVRVYLGSVGGSVTKTSTFQQSPDVWQRFTVELPGPGEHFVYVEIYEPGPNRMAWSAPIWIRQ